MIHDEQRNKTLIYREKISSTAKLTQNNGNYIDSRRHYDVRYVKTQNVDDPDDLPDHLISIPLRPPTYSSIHRNKTCVLIKRFCLFQVRHATG